MERSRDSWQDLVNAVPTIAQLWIRYFSLGVCLLFGGKLAAADPVPGPLAVARNTDGRLELFQVDSDGEVRNRWQREPNGDWSPWSNLGGAFLPGVAAALDGEGKLEVFAVDRRRHLNQIRQSVPNGRKWSKWTDLGGEIDPSVVVGREPDGRLELFAIDSRSGRVKHLLQKNPEGEWGEWVDLGEGPRADLALAVNADGRLEIFASNARHELVHCWQTQAGQNEWSPWASLGGAITGALGVGLNDDGKLEVFAGSSTNGTVQRIVQASTNDSTHWLKWENFGGKVKPGIALAQNADGRMEIFAVKQDGATLQHRFQLRRHADNWLGWRDMGGKMQAAPAVGLNADGTLEIFAPDETSQAEVNYRRQIIANYHWLYWSSLDRLPMRFSPRVWQTDEGLPNNRVQALAQTTDGYLWVGTMGGLARFDGMDFQCDLPSLKSAAITALCAETNGALWIGTDGAGLAKLRDGQAVSFTTNDGLAGNAVRCLLQSRDGSVWIGTTRGLSRWRATGGFQNFTTREGLLSDSVSALCEDRGALWIATSKGLNRLQRNGTMEAFTAANIRAESRRNHWTVRPGAMDPFAATNGVSNNSIRSLYFDKTHRLWIGSDYGLMWYDNGSFYSYTTLYGLSDNFVTTIYEDSRNDLWVGTFSGLNRFIDARFQAELNSHGIAYDQVNAVMEDQRGDIWVGSREGLIRLTPAPFLVKTKQDGLSHNHVTSVLEDHAGHLWLGTWGGGLDEITEDRVRVYSATNPPGNDLILAVTEGKDGSIWAGADKSGGLYRIKNQNVTHYDAGNGLIDAPIRALHEDQEGDLWIGTDHGLGRFSRGVFLTETNAPATAIRAIGEDSAGHLWFGGESGLMERRDRTIKDLTAGGEFPHESVSALSCGEADDLWVGTLNDGLLHRQDGQWRRFGTREGLFSDEILGIAGDQGWLWLASTKGIFRVRAADLEQLTPGRKQTVPCIVYGKADGLESIVCGGLAAPCVWKTADDRLCFATTLGLAVIHPREAGIDLTPPPVYIEQVEVDRKPVPTGNGQRVEIPPSRGELDVRYAAVDLRSPDHCRFKYRLGGVDSDWVDAGAQRAAHYTKIMPGAHRFEVQACNKDGVWNQAGSALDLQFQPNFWQTWWAQALALAALLGLASGMARFVTQRRMQRQMELLEQQHAIERERGRIAKDIHDDLGSSLTRIMLLGQRAKRDLAERKEVGIHLTKIITFSRNTIQAMDEIIWAVNPRNDSLDGFVNYLVEFTDQFFQDTHIRCRLQMPNSSTLGLPTELRHDLFLAIKEALNNVLKHSGASEVRIEVSQARSSLAVIIDDNGCGFDTARANGVRQGNGMQNMRKRMDALAGEMELVSAPGHGTRLRFKVPIPTSRPNN